MSEELAVESVEPETNLDQDQVSEAESNPESAPQEEKPKEDGFQKRINKVTADKHAEKRRADELQRKIDELENKAANKPSKAPTLEDFDYDEEAYGAANIAHLVDQAVKVQADKAAKQAEDLKFQEAQNTFEERVSSFNKDNFHEVANAIPQLPPGVANALTQAENGPELIYHLGEHLDQADKIANMSTEAAMMEIGRISANLSAPKQTKLSTAPEPIETLNSGGAISSKDDGPSGATYE